MLSNYLKTKQAHFNPQQQLLSLSYPQEVLKIDQLPTQYRNARVICLTHCGLTSLKGIEQFEQLQELNVRGNKLSEVEELMRIPNKQLIQRLEFIGNDIQYFGAALFIHLQHHFPNLIELNGRNYHDLIHKHSHKRHQIKHIIARSHNIHQQMLKGLRKEDRKTKQFQRGEEGDTRTAAIHTDEKGAKLEEYYPNNPSDEYENNRSRSKGNMSTSKKQHRSQQSPSPARSRPSPHCKEEKENLNSSNQNEYDVSLADISNIQMTKSIRGPYLQGDKLTNRKGLEIFTLNESPMGIRAPLSQPTATFAMQRQKQGETALMFRNPERTHKYQLEELPIEEGGWKEDEGRPTKREARQSVSEGINESWDSSLCDNIIHQDKSSNELKKIHVATALFTKNLVERVFYAWRHLPPEKNFPVKRQLV